MTGRVLQVGDVVTCRRQGQRGVVTGVRRDHLGGTSMWMNVRTGASRMEAAGTIRDEVLVEVVGTGEVSWSDEAGWLAVTP